MGKKPDGKEDDAKELLRRSFVDAPGHETLMAVMILVPQSWMEPYSWWLPMKSAHSRKLEST